MDFLTYNQDPSWDKSISVDKQVSALWAGGKFGAGASAFASVGGIELMLGDEEFRKFIQKGEFILIVGAESITNPSAVRKLREYNKKYKNLSIKAYIGEGKGIFHPKYNWVQSVKPNEGKVWTSSANLTFNAFSKNKEWSLLVKGVSDAQMEDIRNAWMDWYSNAEPYLYGIEDDELMKKVQARCVQEKKAVEHASRGDKYGTIKLTLAEKEYYEKILSDMQDAMDDAYWYFSKESPILIAEIPKGGDRWQQCNFSESIFVHYFGAEKGVNGTYKITLRCVHTDGSMGKMELRPSVSVKSKNYRFEIDDAKGYDYPEDGSRPIVVFAQIGGQQFLYELVMPNNRNYKHIKAFVDAERFFHPIPNQRKDSCYRQVYPCRDIIEHIKNLGLMKRMEQ